MQGVEHHRLTMRMPSGHRGRSRRRNKNTRKYEELNIRPENYCKIRGADEKLAIPSLNTMMGDKTLAGYVQKLKQIFILHVWDRILLASHEVNFYFCMARRILLRECMTKVRRPTRTYFWWSKVLLGNCAYKGCLVNLLMVLALFFAAQ